MIALVQRLASHSAPIEKKSGIGMNRIEQRSKRHRPLIPPFCMFCLVVLQVASNPSRAQSLDEAIDAAAEQLVDTLTIWDDETFKKLTEGTKGLLKSISEDKLRIHLYKAVINEIKNDASIDQEQLLWLVEIEDQFVEAERGLEAARLMYTLADENTRVVDDVRDRSTAFSGAVHAHAEASRNLQDAKRHLATLRARLEIGESRSKDAPNE